MLYIILYHMHAVLGQIGGNVKCGSIGVPYIQYDILEVGITPSYSTKPKLLFIHLRAISPISLHVCHLIQWNL
jgi:pyrrolidone-carboxylate peptidase